MPDYVVAYEVTRHFEDEEVAHNPDPYEVIDILVRQVEEALRQVPGIVGRTTIRRLRTIEVEGWS